MTDLGNLVYTDDNKVSPLMLESRMPKWRQDALLIIYNGSGGIKGVLPPVRSNQFINALNYVQTELVYDLNIQDEGADYVLFTLEPAVQIDGNGNGFRFVGDKLTRKSFSQLIDPNSYSIYKDAKMISINDVLFSVTGKLMKVYGNTNVKKVFMDYLPVDPTKVNIYDVSTKTYRPFNEETDDYPVSPDVWSIMKALAMAELTPPNLRPADYTNDASTPLEKQTNA